jgi:CDP-glycerol glycerophosphotransferase (TagB/SpsB family)
VTQTGGPQVDVLVRTDKHPDRASTMRALGLDPSRKLIVFSLNAPMYAPDNAGYIRLLLDGIAAGAIEGRPSLIVRMHPFDRESQYDDVVRGRPDVVVQRGFAIGEPGAAFECLPTHADVERYGALMAHADLLLNQASTTSLDAMATDVPVVNIAFDLVPTHPDASIARIYGFTHYRRIVDSRAVRLATSADELFAMMNAYLRDRSLDADRRAEARRQFIAFSDGQAAFRIASRIWEIA